MLYTYGSQSIWEDSLFGSSPERPISLPNIITAPLIVTSPRGHTISTNDISVARRSSPTISISASATVVNGTPVVGNINNNGDDIIDNALEQTHTIEIDDNGNWKTEDEEEAHILKYGTGAQE